MKERKKGKSILASLKIWRKVWNLNWFLYEHMTKSTKKKEVNELSCVLVEKESIFG